ncbi:MAG: YIP1 family protein [Candidatus Woesearchaeota archaeon]
MKRQNIVIQSKYKYILIFILLCFVMFLKINPSFAVIPYRNFTFDYWGSIQAAPQAYTPVKETSGSGLGVGDFNNPQDLFVRDNNLYILDSDNNRIVIQFSSGEIKEINEYGSQELFNSPQGIYVTEDKEIYVADTGNQQVIVIDHQGKLLDRIVSPQSYVEGVFPENFQFYPLKLIVDPNDRIFVLARNVYDGILSFDSQGSFDGFIGAPEVTPSFSDLFWSVVSTEEQRKRRRLTLPISYANVDVTEQGFIFAVESGTAENNSIKKLNPAGNDILQRQGFFAPAGRNIFGSLIENPTYFVDVISRNFEGFSALCRANGEIYTYDNNGRLLYVFGERGFQKGQFRNPVALAEKDDQLLVLDRKTGLITFFEPTSYVKNIHQALLHYQEGRYENALKMWENVLEQNANFDLAYTGIGRNFFQQEEYEKSMNMFKQGNNRPEYSKAFGYYRRQVIHNQFNIVLVILFLIFVILFLINKYGQKVSVNLSKKIESKAENNYYLALIHNTFKSLRFSIYAIFHPFGGFWVLKHEKKGSILSANIIILLVIMTYIFVRQYTGFIFNHLDLNQLNIYIEFVSVFLPFILWCIANWSVSTLMDGKGYFKDIYITTAVALLPIFIINIPVTVVSNYLLLEEGNFYYFFLSLSIVWFLVLLFFGTLTIHDYSLGKTILTFILTIIGIGFLIFIGLLFFNLINEFYVFINQIYNEIYFRL